VFERIALLGVTSTMHLAMHFWQVLVFIHVFELGRLNILNLCSLRDIQITSLKQFYKLQFGSRCAWGVERVFHMFEIASKRLH